MPSPPAICPHGHVFVMPNLIGGEGGQRITFGNVNIGPCPVCGEMGQVMDGEYEIDRSPLMKRVSDHVRELSPSDRRELTQILREVQANEAKLDEVLAREQELSVSLGEVLREVQELREESRRSGKLQTFLAVIAILLSIIGGSDHESIGPPSAPPAVVQTYRPVEREGGGRQRPGKHDPCWCGNGRRFMNCHGRHRGVVEPDAKNGGRTVTPGTKLAP